MDGRQDGVQELLGAGVYLEEEEQRMRREVRIRWFAVTENESVDG